MNDRLPAARGLYDPAHEHDACGVGFVADLEGRRSHRLLQLGLTAGERLSHRGAMDADAQSSDGAGVLTQIPERLFAREIKRLGLASEGTLDVGVGMFFMPRAEAAFEATRALVESIVRKDGLNWLGWREVPVSPEVLGDKARAAMPRIWQALVARPVRLTAVGFERALYMARKAIETAVAEKGFSEFYACSFSSRSIVYKGLLASGQLAPFYADLRDPDYETALCLFHQRYSTNTFPTWPLAQPYRYLGHNGEINTVSGNRYWTQAREGDMAGGRWKPEEIERLKPVIQAGGSDSTSLDNVLELLVASGRSVAHAMAMLIPEAYEHSPLLTDAERAFYEYHHALTEPWGGPAAVAFSDGELIGARLDRNGLRPSRYVVTEDGLIVLGSEVGMVDLPESAIVEKGRLGPGEMLVVDTVNGRLFTNAELRRVLASRQPYRAWIEKHQVRLGPSPGLLVSGNGGHEDLLKLQTAFGYSLEEVERLIAHMANEGKEAVGAMGDDTPLAIFSEKPRPLYHYFKQRFAQVTNPPIDPLREKLNMSLTSLLGARRSILSETPEHARLVKLNSPIMTDGELAFLKTLSGPGFKCGTLDATWNVLEGEAGLEHALERLCEEAVTAVKSGYSLVVVSDRRAGKGRAAVPMLIAIAGIHRHLIRAGLRMRASLIAETGEPREEHHFACLIGYGANAVNPYLALKTAYALGEAAGGGPMEVMRYKEAVEAGLRKIMAKMGITTISSYRGAQIFEAVGVSRELVDRFFAGTPSPVGGIGLSEIARQALAQHREAYGGEEPPHKLTDLGLFRYRVGGEYHAFNPAVFKAIQKVGKSGESADFQEIATAVAERPPLALRDRLRFRKVLNPVPLEEVEPATAIARRFTGAAMSMGALSREAHEAVAIALNRIGARSNSGEGGEAESRYHPLPNGDSANSAIKQVASGRFGVTPSYLVSASELEIKMAQGSKPGEGGQLPGKKVNEEIALLRRATPGTTLISPPPHHDIYSIEDLAQLIYDLKRVNPEAPVAVKLVSESGVGTIAAGVAKAHADRIHISGADGGTGASPLGSIKHAGAPWELGLAEAQQVLMMNNLRDRVALRVDGGLKSGRDVMVAALLGAEEFGFGTTLLVAAGCVMVRQCHANTCPVGIATQDPKLRARFKGTPDNIVNYLLGVAEDVRVLLAELGFRTLDEAVGRVDMLELAEPLPGKAGTLDLSALIMDPDPSGQVPRRRHQPFATPPANSLDDGILEAATKAIEGHGTFEGDYEIRNGHRTVGGRLAGAIAKLHGDHGFRGQLTLRFTGSAGQSFGAFALDGLAMHLVGDANDYVGKGMAGGVITVRPPEDARYEASESVIIGNTVMYGATGGRLFAAGRAGERFCVRNSGGTAVIEGVGDHGCEYMTGGVVVVLGPTGRNFAAGMTGGVAYVLDEEDRFTHMCNRESVLLEALEGPEDADELRRLVAEHAERTGSKKAQALLADWETALTRFWRVQPHASEALPVPVAARQGGEKG